MDSNEINEDENIIEANTLTEALIDYIESSTNGISISIDLLKKTIVPLKRNKRTNRIYQCFVFGLGWYDYRYLFIGWTYL